MGRIIAVYGTIAGAIVVAGMFINISFLADHGAMGMVAGYLSMLVALIFVFVGVKRYRDVDLGGVIGFWKAFGVGIGIGLVAGLFYVLGWELYMWRTGGTFIAVERVLRIGRGVDALVRVQSVISRIGAVGLPHPDPQPARIAVEHA